MRSDLTEPRATICPGALGIGTPSNSLSSLSAMLIKSALMLSTPSKAGPCAGAAAGGADAEVSAGVAGAEAVCSGFTAASSLCPSSFASACKSQSTSSHGQCHISSNHIVSMMRKTSLHSIAGLPPGAPQHRAQHIYGYRAPTYKQVEAATQGRTCALPGTCAPALRELHEQQRPLGIL